MMADTTTTIPELALPILLHQVVHFSDAIIAQDVDRMKNWEALEFFWGKLSQEYKDGSDGSDELFATRYNMCKILLAAACCDPYNDDFVMQEKDEEDDSLDILSIPAPPLLYFTKEMWKALIKLLNKILKDIKGNENDRTFKGIVGLRRAIHAQIALADFRVILELYANQGENKSETAELRGQLRDAAAALLKCAEESSKDDEELAELLKKMLDSPKRAGKRKGGHEYVQFVSAGAMRKILNSKPFGLRFIRHEINKIMLEWGSDTFQSVAAADLIQDTVFHTVESVEAAVDSANMPSATSATAPDVAITGMIAGFGAVTPVAAGIPLRVGVSTTEVKSRSTKRKVLYQGEEVQKEPNQVVPPPIIIKLNGARKKTRFSDEEKEAIRQGVLKYGVGKWAQIKEAHEVTLRNRTSVNIKDCYRTMCKRNEFQLPSAAQSPHTPSTGI